MKKLLLSLLVMSALMLSVVPGVFATSVGSGVDVNIVTEDFPPIVWQCDHRVVFDDGTEPGRMTEQGEVITERINNYAFEGEQIQWKVLVMDKNGIDKVKEVYASVHGDVESNCERINEGQFENSESVTTDNRKIDSSCNAQILEEKITDFNPETMAYYLCTLTVETPSSMHGQYDINVEAEDLNGLFGTMAETETWFLNPVVEVAVDGEEMLFDEVRPGTSSYSGKITVENYAEQDSGVILDMFISGTDFYDKSSSGAKCGESNVLELKNFRYYATNGYYSTNDDSRSDAEGYVPIQYGIGFNDPAPFYNRNEIMTSSTMLGLYYASNLLSPGNEMSIIFRLDLPEPCNGDFNTGQIYFWGEAV